MSNSIFSIDDTMNTSTITLGDTTLNSGLYTYTDYSGIGPITINDSTFPNGSLEVRGDANFEGDIKIKGKSLVESLEKIEEKLAILRPNEELESRWEELRKLRKKYMKLEKELIEKEKVWGILKK